MNMLTDIFKAPFVPFSPLFRFVLHDIFAAFRGFLLVLYHLPVLFCIRCRSI